MLINIFIFTLLCLALFTAFLVILWKNPVYSVLSLVVLFVIVSIILLVLEVEFFALIYIIVYVGAVAVLFLFVIMMLDLREKYFENKINLNLLFFCGLVSLINIWYTLKFFFSYSNFWSIHLYTQEVSKLSDFSYGLSDIKALKILFSDTYGILLIFIGLMFFIVMLGTINLHIQQNNDLGKKHISPLIYKRNNYNSILVSGSFNDISYYEKLLYFDWTTIKPWTKKKFFANLAVAEHFQNRKKRVNAIDVWDHLEFGKFTDLFWISDLSILQPGLINFANLDEHEIEELFTVDCLDFINLNSYWLFADFYTYFNYDSEGLD
jgi:NADH-quinone oxidoreductase subunit J